MENEAFGIESCEKSFGDLKVLKDISMSVEDGKSFPSSALQAPANQPSCAVHHAGNHGSGRGGLSGKKGGMGNDSVPFSMHLLQN